MGREDDIQGGEVAQAPPQQQQQQHQQLKQAQADAGPPSKQARVEKGGEGTGGGTVDDEVDKPVTRIDTGALDKQESLESMRETNTPITGDELYREAVPAGAEDADAGMLLVEQERSASASEGAKDQGGTQQGDKDSSKSGTPGSPSKRAKVSSPKGTNADSGVSKPVTRLESGTLDKQESLESMRESNAPHTGEQLYEDAVPAAEGTVNKPKGRGSKRNSR